MENFPGHQKKKFGAKKIYGLGQMENLFREG